MKTGAVSAADLRGITEFVRRHRGFRPLLVCDGSQLRAAERLGVAAVAWPDFLLSGPPHVS